MPSGAGVTSPPHEIGAYIRVGELPHRGDTHKSRWMLSIQIDRIRRPGRLWSIIMRVGVYKIGH